MFSQKHENNRLVMSSFVVLLCLIFAYLFLFRGLQYSEASSAVQQESLSERQLVIHEPSMPKNAIEITNTRSLQSTNFPSGFEMDIKNISGKPIFYIRFVAVLTNSRPFTPSGRPVGFDLFYGNRRLHAESERAQAGDQSVPPGGTATLRVMESNSRAISVKAQRDPDFASEGRSKIVLVLQSINFGDGTSYLNDKLYKHQ